MVRNDPWLSKLAHLFDAYIRNTSHCCILYLLILRQLTISPQSQKREAKSSNKTLLYLVTAIIIAIISILNRPAISSFAQKFTSRISTKSYRQVSPMSTLQFKFRPSETRGNADHGWLKVSPILVMRTSLTNRLSTLSHLPVGRTWSTIRMVHYE